MYNVLLDIHIFIHERNWTFVFCVIVYIGGIIAASLFFKDLSMQRSSLSKTISETRESCIQLKNCEVTPFHHVLLKMSFVQVSTISDIYCLLKKTNNQSVQSNKERSAINCSIHTGKSLLLQLFWCLKIVEEASKSGMYGTAFFCFGAGRGWGKIFGLGRGGVTVKLGSY